jgi:hypothetical protein
MRIHRVVLLVGLLALGMPRLLCAQEKEKDDSDKSCEKAAKIIRKGHPEKKEEWALGVLTNCGKAGADAFVDGIAQQATVSDTLALETFYSHVDVWRDATIMNASLDLARNVTATPTARVFAVRHLVQLVRARTRFPYGELVRGSTVTVTPDSMTTYTPGCVAWHGSEIPDQSATSLPADYPTTIRTALTTLVNDPATPDMLKKAARCIN